MTDYANIWGMRSLTQFTVCFWMKTSDTNEGTPFSYAVPGRANEILFMGYNNFRLWVGDTERYPKFSIQYISRPYLTFSVGHIANVPDTHRCEM